MLSMTMTDALAIDDMKIHSVDRMSYNVFICYKSKSTSIRIDIVKNIETMRMKEYTVSSLDKFNYMER